MRRLLPLLLPLLLPACGNGLAAREAFLNQFIGHPESEVVQVMGVPTRTIETGGIKYLAYTESRVDVVPGLGPYGAGPWWNYGWYGGGFPPQLVTLTCETTIAVADGMVKSYNLRGNACG